MISSLKRALPWAGIVLLVVCVVGAFFYFRTQKRRAIGQALVNARQMAEQGRYDQAIHYYEKAVQGDPTLKEVYIAIALMYRAKGDHVRVKEYCARVAADESVKTKKAYRLACEP